MPKLSDVQPNLANHIASVNKDSIIHLFNDNISDVSCNEMSSAMRSDSDMDIDNLVWEDDHELYDNPNVYKGSTVEEMHECTDCSAGMHSKYFQSCKVEGKLGVP